MYAHPKTYASYAETNITDCCLLAGVEHHQDCIDSFGDGCHGGYLDIEGTVFCEDFDSSDDHHGHSEVMSTAFLYGAGVNNTIHNGAPVG